MLNQKRLGVYWGEERIELVEVHKSVPVLRTSVPFSSIHTDELNIQSISEDARFLEIIQRSCRNAAFSTVDVHLSLASKDIILRWFLTPFMKPNEIQEVVSFEARKYLPFPIEDLVYNYNPSVINGPSGKQIGILFVGIKRDIYQRYVQVLSQSGLNVIYSEPACISFLRVLMDKKIVQPEQVNAILLTGKTNYEIYIVNKGIVKFVRDFSLGVPFSPDQDMSDFIKVKLANEVRVSLDFFSRQQADTDVQRIVVLDSFVNYDFYKGLSEDIGLAVFPYEIGTLLEIEGGADICHLGAYGAALSGVTSNVIDFNLAESEQREQSPKQVRAAFKMPSFLPFAVGGGLLLILGLVWFFFNSKVTERESEVSAVRTDLGEYADLSFDEVESLKNKEIKLVKALKNLEIRSSTVPVLMEIFRLLPDSMWLEQLTLTYETATSVGNDGMPRLVYAPVLSMSLRGIVMDANAGFNEVNNFLITLKTNPQVRSVFKEVALGDVASDEGKRFTVVSFPLSFK